VTAVPEEPAGPAPGIPGCPPGGAPGFPDDADRVGDVDVLFLAGQCPAPPGEWLLITAAGGEPGAEFTARVLPAGERYGHGGDVLVHLAAVPGLPEAVSVGAWAVMCGHMVPVAAWDRQEPEGWPEKIRSAVVFAVGVLTGLEDYGADLRAGHRVDLDEAAATAAAGVPAGLAPGPAACARPGRR